ncbi:MAG: flavin reductase family protein [Rickettsiaceae bacterium H1]|nr:flavin reductase family protein [Rickettsiaceae bacterium H1]
MNLFKECMSLFATGVTVVTTENETGKYGITINSFCSLSLKPMMILFNLEKIAERFQIFYECEKFTINVLSDKQQQVSKAFAETNTKQYKRYFQEYDGKLLPSIKGSLCHIHCDKHKMYDGGDHKIITGIVKSMKKNYEGNPLIYYKSNYYELHNE